jgi:predicted Rossmann fold flavoprotein
MPRVAVIGAGAAGTMAAIFAASAGAETVLLESTRDGGRKILISGGGRCNILPVRLDESRFVTDSPRHLLRHIVRSWPLADQAAFFERDLDLPLVEETESGKLFPRSQSARDVRDKLLALAQRKGVALVANAPASDLVRFGSGWRISSAGRDPIDADAVVIATGGLSVPSTGSSGWGLRVAERFGHTVHQTYPALTPLVATGGTGAPSPFAHLSGVSLHVSLTARANGRRAESSGGFLFTHHGYSGPSVLDVSHVAVRSIVDGTPRADVTVRWTSLRDVEWEEALRARGSRTVLAAVSSELPHRLAEALLDRAQIPSGRALSQLSRSDRMRLIRTLVEMPLPWTGDEGYKKAEVTGGGVSLSEIDPKTMESRMEPALFLCGEMLDAFGPIGGYNFLWAWATGRAAGIGAARPKS